MMKEAFDIVNQWFWPWLAEHQEVHRSDFWVKHDAPNAIKFYRGWIESFVKAHISKSEAEVVSRRMQERPAPHPDKALPLIKQVVYELREERKKAKEKRGTVEDPAWAEAARRSQGCPECSEGQGKATGWATRRRRDPRLPFLMSGSLYCRCPLGQLRAAGDVPEQPMFQALGTDLQAHPELWHPSMTHISWSSTPSAAHTWDDGQGWWLPVGAGEPPPKPRRAGGLVPHAAEAIGQPPTTVPVVEPPSHVPEGLTPMQVDFFIHFAGRGGRQRWHAMPPDQRAAVLDTLGPEPDDRRIDRAKAMIFGNLPAAEGKKIGAGT